MSVDVGSTPQFEAPTLADLCRRINERPLWAVEDPLSIDPETYEIARNEMVEVQMRRGFPVACADIGRPNFLLRGVPVVMADE